MFDRLEDHQGPRRSDGDTVQQTLVGSVRVLLLALMAVPILLVVLSSFFLGTGTISITGTFLLLGLSAVSALALARLRVGKVGQAVGLVITGSIVTLAWETLQSGVLGFSPFLFAYSVPIAFAALLVGRRALIASSAASIGVVTTVFLLEAAGATWIGTDTGSTQPGTLLIAFILITALLALVLERFGVELKSAHAAALRREHDLANLVVELELQIEERMAAERERERLFELERVARQSAETSGARLSFLAEASHLLASSLDFGETLRRLTALVVPRWADWCAIDILDENGDPRPLSVVHQDPKKAKTALHMQTSYKLREGSPGPITVIATGVTQYLPKVTEADMAAAAQNPEHLQLLRLVGLESLIVVPLVARGTAFGALTLATAESGRGYGEEDVVFFEELSARASVAVENSRLFAQIRSLNRDLEERVDKRTRDLSNVLSELEAFAYSVSHDLRTPLRGIDGFSQTLLDDYSDRLDSEGVSSLERIRAAASRMGILIDALLTLLSLSRGELEIEELDLSDMAAGLVRELQERNPEREVEVRIEPGMSARADRELFQVAVANIIDNAWKFSRMRQKSRIEIGTTDLDGENVFFVRDDGLGFEMAYYNKLFTPFQRLHTSHFEGIGIGLAVAQRVLLRHGGRIWAEGKAGEGATFYFTIGL